MKPLAYRYSCFSVTGYGIVPEGRRTGPTFRTGVGGHDPITTWYVFDTFNCAEIVFETAFEHIARKKALDLNARQRQLDKEQERELIAARNGHGA